MLGSDDKTRRTRPLSSALGNILQASDGILDMLPIATFVCDAAGTILQYNWRAVEIWGRAPQPGQTHESFTAGVRFFDIDGQPLRSGLADVLATGQPARDVERIVERADGSRLIVSLNIDPLRNAKGEIIGAVNCFLDITERKRVDAALLEQEQRLAATYEHASIGISEIAPDGSFLRVNEAICGITGFSREHLLASRLFAHTHPDDAEPDREGFRKQVAGDLDFYSVEKRFIRKDGRTIWMSTFSSIGPHGIFGTLVLVAAVISLAKTWSAMTWMSSRLIFAQALIWPSATVARAGGSEHGRSAPGLGRCQRIHPARRRSRPQCDTPHRRHGLVVSRTQHHLESDHPVAPPAAGRGGQLHGARRHAADRHRTLGREHDGRHSDTAAVAERQRCPAAGVVDADRLGRSRTPGVARAPRLAGAAFNDGAQTRLGKLAWRSGAGLEKFVSIVYCDHK